MNVDTVIIFGSNGMLGSACVEYFNTACDVTLKRVIGYDRSSFDVLTAGADRLEELAEEWLSSGWHPIVINAIGIIPQKKEIRSDVFIKVNSVFPHILSNVCRARRIQFIHITTDCVFDGSDGPYSELSKHTETGIYGVSKSCGEPDQAMIIRTSIIGLEPRSATPSSLLEWTLKTAYDRRPILGYTNHHWNGVTCLQLAKVIHQLVRDDIQWRGVRHITSPEPTTKYQLIQDMVTVFGLGDVAQITPFEAPTNINKVLVPSSDPKLQDILKGIPPIVDQLKELHRSLSL
jgi:dTDP-4-dehydrorhamnose reductase